MKNEIDRIESKELSEVLMRLEKAILKAEQTLSSSLTSLKQKSMNANAKPDDMKEMAVIIESIGKNLEGAMEEIRAILKE